MENRRGTAYRLPPRIDKHGPHRLKGLDALTGTHHDTLHGSLNMGDRYSGLIGQTLVETTQEAATTYQVEALHEQVLCQFGGRLGKA